MTRDTITLSQRPRRRFLAGLLALSFLPGLSPAHAQEAPEVVPVVIPSWTDVRMVDIEAPRFPRSAVQRGMEGWVRLGFTVNENGRTEDVRVIDAGEDSSMHGTMERAAMKVVEDWTFEPATVDGEAVAREGEQTIAFPLYAGNAVPSGYLEIWREGSEALEQGDLGVTAEAIEDLEGRYLLRNTERLYLTVLKARYERAAGNAGEAQRLVKRALRQYDDHMNAPAFEASLLRDAMDLAAEQKDYVAALERYEKLVDAHEVSEDDPVQAAAERLRDRLDGPDTLVREAELQPCERCDGDLWRTSWRLNRQLFSLALDGEAPQRVTVRCRPVEIDLSWAPERRWHLEGQLADCTVSVYGQTAGKARLIEPPGTAMPVGSAAGAEEAEAVQS